MSSSGLIYAFIVGAWAVYLVPMWLRREDELNNARQTRRYTTAIKVLSHKDSFERRYGAADEKEQARELPLAAGQNGPAPGAGKQALDRVKQKERERAAASAPPQRRVTAKVEGPAAGATAAAAKWAAPVAAAAEPEADSSVWTPAPLAVPAPKRTVRPTQSARALAGLRARRRKVVGFLFALTSLGAIVSADLGLAYVWAMLLPAAVLSAYIAWCRKDERTRAAERARRRAAAARAAREAEREAERRELEQQRAQDEADRLEREELARRSAVARRRVAAARSRAERRGAPDQGDLPRAANG